MELLQLVDMFSLDRLDLIRLVLLQYIVLSDVQAPKSIGIVRKKKGKKGGLTG